MACQTHEVGGPWARGFGSIGVMGWQRGDGLVVAVVVVAVPKAHGHLPLACRATSTCLVEAAIKKGVKAQYSHARMGLVLTLLLPCECYPEHIEYYLVDIASTLIIICMYTVY